MSDDSASKRLPQVRDQFDGMMKTLANASALTDVRALQAIGTLDTGVAAALRDIIRMNSDAGAALRQHLSQQGIALGSSAVIGRNDVLARQISETLDRNSRGIARFAADALQTSHFTQGSLTRAVNPDRAVERPTDHIRTAADIGALVRRARKAVKMNQAQFAAHAGVGRRFVSELESGKASLEFDRVMACAEAAGVDLVARARAG